MLEGDKIDKDREIIIVIFSEINKNIGQPAKEATRNTGKGGTELKIC